MFSRRSSTPENYNDLKDSIRNYILLVLRGMGMGAADVIPGVSGGTIAFITGIYEELVFSIKSINLLAVRLFFTGRWRSFWKQINGNFLLSVFAGIFISVLSIARVLEYLLEHHPVLIWSFFFGLILASSYVVSRKITRWEYPKVVALVGGIGIAFYITSVTPATTTDAFWFVILSGALASCAMILPGISGSFILLLLGKYEFALHAVNERIILDLLLLGAGAIAGLVLFANLLSWLLKKYYEITIAVLVGFMIGSLNKIWPWKETLKTILVEGEVRPLVEKNILPSLGSAEDQVWMALLMAGLGIALILLLEMVLSRNPQAADQESNVPDGL
jgi:putative membrane protein